jgi:hypothetical protein
LGEVRSLRRVRFSDRRWAATYKHSKPSPDEAKRISEEIGRMRYRSLPLPGDVPVSLPPVMLETRYFSHPVPDTSLRLVYQFDDDERTLLVLSLHRLRVA